MKQSSKSITVREKYMPTPSLSPSPRLLALALRLAISGCVLVPPLLLPAAQAQAQAAAPATRQYQIPAGPLKAVLTRFVGESGIFLAGSTELAEGKTSRGLQGSFDVPSGLATLLAGSGLDAVRSASGEYTLRVLPASTAKSSEQTMAAVVVTAARDNVSEGTGSYTARALSLGKVNASLRETPHSLTVISRQQIEDQGLSDLNDVLRNTPGIEVFNTDSERVSYYARGQEITNVQFDGNAAITPGSGNGFYIQPDMATMDHAEVLRGAAGLMRGAGSPSGAVNLVRKRPTDHFAASGVFTGGSWDTYRAEGDISGPLNASGSLRGRVVAVKDERQHFQKARYSDKGVLYGVLESDIAANTTLLVGAEFSQLKTNGAWGNLLANIDGSPMDFPRDTYLGSAQNHWDRQNRQVFASLEHDFGNGWSAKASFDFIRMNRMNGENGYVQTLISRNTKDPSKINYQISRCGEKDYTAEQSSWDLYASGPFSLLGRQHELVVGANGTRDYAQPVAGSCSNISGLASMTGLDPHTWNPYTVAMPAAAPFTGTYVKNLTEQQGVYSTVRFSVSDPLTVIVGARMSWWDYKPDAVASGYSVDAELTPYVAALYTLNDNLTAYGSYADVFTPQRAFGVGGTPLKPITGRNLELGIKGEFLNKRLNTNLAIFQLDQNGKAVDDLSSPNPCPPDYSNGYCQIADGEQRSRGFEAEVSGQLNKNWNLTAGYTLNNTKYVRDTASNTGKALRTTTPKHLVRLFTTYNLPGELNQWSVGGGLNLQSEITSQSGTAFARQGGYTLASSFVSYRVSRRLSAQLNVTNLFDKVYYEKIREYGPGYYYGAPRGVMLTLLGQY
jgi:outer membrane receptor for ferric coprogen and ferric-rhodotorulic acid